MRSVSESVLSANDLSFSYGSQKVLSKVSLNLRRGEITALLGPNASGKTTLLKCLGSLLQPLEGEITLQGKKINNYSEAKRAQVVAYVGPELRIDFPLSAQDAVGMGRLCHNQGIFMRSTVRDQQVVKQAMLDCHCWNLRDQEVQYLSGGQKQLIGLARALAQEAKILLLDEALSKMDLNHQALMGRMFRKLASQGYSFCVVSHDVNLVTEWANQCVLFDRGQVLESGAPTEVLTVKNFKKLYPGVEFVMGQNPANGARKIFWLQDEAT